MGPALVSSQSSTMYNKQALRGCQFSDSHFWSQAAAKKMGAISFSHKRAQNARKDIEWFEFKSGLAKFGFPRFCLFAWAPLGGSYPLKQNYPWWEQSFFTDHLFFQVWKKITNKTVLGIAIDK